MTFIEIFNTPGLYQADSFASGVCIRVEDKNVFGLVGELLTFESKTDTFGTPEPLIVTKSLVNKTYRKILNRNQLFEKTT